MSKLFFKAGEFAALCGVKKDTLFHYDEIGILKPEIIANNGYRYYSTKQFFTFDIISALKEVGTPLKEIKEYITHQDTTYFLAILKDKQIKLEEEQKRIERMRKILQNTITTTENALSIICGKIEIEYHNTEYLIAIEASKTKNDVEKEYPLKIREHIDYCRKYDYDDEILIGEIVLKENLENGIFEESYYFSKIAQKADCERLLVKPAGNYAVYYYKSAYETRFEAYHILIEHLNSKGCKIIGNAYEEDILNYLSISDKSQYLFKLSVQIE